MILDKWKLIGDPALLTDKAKALYEEAILVAPAVFMKDNVTKMLPRQKSLSKCRLCGITTQLTKEHIPPKKSGNNYRTVHYDIHQWLDNQKLDISHSANKKQQGGIYGYTLCSDCNSFTGTLYGSEYQKWILGGFDALSRLPKQAIELDQELGPWCIKTRFGNKENSLKPGAFVRQVLSMFCSLSGTWDIAERYPEIRRTILEQTSERLPRNIDLNIALYLGPMLRFSGPQLRVDIPTNTWQWIMEIAYPPYSFLMILASNKEELLDGVIINDWSILKPTEVRSFEAEIGVGFGWLPFPGDYRSRAKIKKDSDG